MKNYYFKSLKLIVLTCFLSFLGQSQVINTESFNGTTFVPAGWTAIGTTTAMWGRVTTGANPTQAPNSGAGQACFFSYNYSTGNAGIVTPPFSLQNNTSGAVVSFFMYRDNGYLGTPDMIQVYYNNVASVTGATLLGTVNRAIDLTPTVTANGWYPYTFTVPSTFTSTSSYIIFNGTTAFGNNTFIDDISWTSYPNLCSGSPATPSIAISTPSGCPNTGFNITTTGATNALGISYQWEASNALAGTYSAIPNATNTSLSSQSVASTTFYRMITTCSVSSLSSTTSVMAYSVVNPGPCVCSAYGPSGPTQPGDEDIYLVRIGTLNNLTNCSSVASGPGSIANRYSNYAGVVAAPNICTGSSAAYTVNVGSCSTAWYGVGTAVFIDFNQNGSFADPGEQVMGSTAFSTFISPVTAGSVIASYTGNIAIPATASLGITRMRVITQEGTSLPTPASSYGYGETEDYCINIVGPSSITAVGGSVCPGQPFVITPSGSSTYTYVTPTGSLTGASATVSPIANTNYTINSTNSFGCVSNGTNAAIVNVASLAAPQLTASSTPTAYCVGGSAMLSVSGANTYTWTSPASNASSFSVSPIVTTVYTVSGTGTNVCNGVTTVTVVVNQIPTITINSGSICSGFAYTLTPGGASTYTINSASGTLTSNIVSPNALENYTVNGTSAGGCVSIASVAPISTVFVLPSPTITASSATVCSGVTFSLNIGGSNNTYSVNGVSVGTNVSIPYAITSNANYTVNGTNSNGCTAFAPPVAMYTVVALPTLSLTASTNSICVGQASANLSVSGANTYTWSTNATGTTIAVSPSVASVYTVVGTSTLMCNNSSTVTINVWTLPQVSSAASQNFICVGGNTTLTAMGANTYSWSNSATSSLVVVNPTISTNYVVTGTDLNGCRNTSTVAVDVNTIVLTVNPTSTTVCLGSSVTFTANGAVSYTWNGTHYFNTFPTTPSVATQYSVTAIDANNCVLNKTVLASINQLPNVMTTISSTLICTGESATITASGATSYSWNTNATTASIVVSPTLAVLNGYTVKGTDANNCSVTLTRTLAVSECLGIDKTFEKSTNVNVYPNPSAGSFNVDLNGAAVKNIQVIDLTGRMIINQTVTSDKVNLNLNNYASGIYYLKIIGVSNTQTIKLVKE